MTEFGAYPDLVSPQELEKIEASLREYRKIAPNLFASMGYHPGLGPVLILKRDDGTGGYVFSENVIFR